MGRILYEGKHTNAVVTLLTPLPTLAPFLFLVVRLFFVFILVNNESFPYPPFFLLVLLRLLRTVVRSIVLGDRSAFLFFLFTTLHWIIFIFASGVLHVASRRGHGGKSRESWG